MAVIFIYARGLRASAPHSITNELAPRLRAAFGDVKVYDLSQIATIVPQEGDILIGHPHQDVRTAFQASIGQRGWKRRAVLCPFSHAHLELNGWMDQLVEQADLFLAITGKYWFDTMEDSPLSHWKYKTRRLDLAVNPKWFPAVKRGWNAPGKRKFLYIGYTAPAKGTDYLCQLADANPALHFGWMGGGFMPTPRVEILGPSDFNLPESLRLVASFDFIIACGRSDANPTTLLEGLAWGLVPVCTPQSGYRNERWLVNIPLDNVEAASAVLQRLNTAPEEELNAIVARGRAELERHYTWDRFGNDVVAALREPAPSKPTSAEWQERAAANKSLLAEKLGGRK
ncbi:MAG TPA: hypothetical protein VHM90_14715 [Phycisphaerae bacterium]|nr:hypothetical protein [Phycisphaerae bacterium]